MRVRIKIGWHDVSILFLSHSSKNDAVANDVSDWLKARGHEAFFVDHSAEDGIVGGQRWEDRLKTELKRCRVLIALVGSDWLQSPWCVAEINYADAMGSAIIPIHIADRKVDQAFAALLRSHGPPVLSRVQAIAWAEGEPAEQWLLAALTEAGVDDAMVYQGTRPPYPGLNYFDTEDAPVFFGRGQEITDLLMILRECRAPGRARLIIIAGASGTGKSSLLRAGVLSRLARSSDWIVLPAMRPLRAPLSELAGVLRTASGAKLDAHPEDNDAAKWAVWIDESATRIRENLRKLEATVLLPIDQMEEALGDTDGAGTSFLKSLREALARTDHRFLAIATLTADSVGAWEKHEARRAPAADGELLLVRNVALAPVARAGLFSIIEEPAMLAGLTYEPGLVNRMVDESGGEDALPLLAYVLEQLWNRYGRDDLRITAAEYDTFGGIENAVGLHAEKIFGQWQAELAAQGVSSEEIAQRTNALRQLLLVDLAAFFADGRLVRRPLAVINIPAELTGFVDKMETGRLLVRREGTTEVAHDALYRRWPRLADWRGKSGKFLPVLAEVRSEMAKNPAGFIPEGTLLDQAKSLLIDNILRPDPAIHDFITQSVARARRRQRRFSIYRSAAFIGAIAAALFGIFAVAISLLALTERDRAVSREAASLALLSRSMEGNGRAAAELALEALPPSPKPVAGLLQEMELSGLAETALAYFRPRIIGSAAIGALSDAIRLNPRHGPWLVGHTDSVRLIAWSPDGRGLATASWDNTGRLWDAASGQEIAVLKGHENSVTHIAWSPDGRRLATASGDNTARMFPVFGDDTSRLIDCALGQVPQLSANAQRLIWSIGKTKQASRPVEELDKTPSYQERWRLSEIACGELLAPGPVDEKAQAYLRQYQ